ncbi:MAG: hypothetical protein M1822_008522 [Bathelium mastoideum]|nr:MAG: hypothetical protein M1822_008522 [Bathelium mastoideum]
MTSVASSPPFQPPSSLNALRRATLTRQPLKALWVLLAVSTTLVRLPFWTLLYLLPSLRPHPQWTFRQALGVRIVRLIIFQTSLVEAKPPTPLTPGGEKNRFVVIDPADDTYKSCFAGVLLPASSDAPHAVKPQRLGATWYPSPPIAPVQPSEPASRPAADGDGGDVVLHLHGGAFVVGDGRTADAGFAASTFRSPRGAAVARVLAPQYRLSSHEGGHFPAALQDAVLSYAYLVRACGIAPSRIIVSGDSAGGNLVIGLLRYITEYGAQVGLEAPGCAWLWSPWVDLAAARDMGTMPRNPRYKTDYLTPWFGYWGSASYAPTYAGSAVGVHDGWVSPLGKPFATRTPVWVQTGSAEVLYEDDKAFAEQMKGVDGNRVECHVVQHAPHDICLIGHLLGWKDQTLDCAKRAGEFARRERQS